MYTLTIIRLNLTTKQFENTEAHNIMYDGGVERELVYHNANAEQIEKFNGMEIGETKVICIENALENKIWFYYISKFK